MIRFMGKAFGTVISILSVLLIILCMILAGVYGLDIVYMLSSSVVFEGVVALLIRIAFVLLGFLVGLIIDILVFGSLALIIDQRRRIENIEKMLEEYIYEDEE